MTQGKVGLPPPSNLKPPAPTSSIPQQTFVGAGENHALRGRLDYMGLEWLLQTSRITLGVTGFQLARLVGSNWPSKDFAQWNHCRQRMGSLYLSRLFYLW